MRVVVRCLAALSLLAAVLTATSTAQAAGTTVTVTDGGAPGWVRFDDQGNGVDAHDGEIKQFYANGSTKYYLYGTSYGCGYVRLHGYAPTHDAHPVTPFCGFVAYESTDLRHWKYDGQLFDPATTTPTDWQHICNSATLSCYRPHVLYDASTGYFRLWVNTYDRGPDGVEHGYHVLSSRSPVGPFVEAADSSGNAVLPRLAFPSGGDFDVFQDNDKSAYIVYSARYDALGAAYGYKLVVESLSRNYTTGTGVFTTLDTRHTEAPSMFRRGSSYYITMADPYCAYCAGTGAAYLRASSPLGPWRGVGGNVALTSGQMYVDSRMALFTGATSDMQNTLRNQRDYDVTFRARALPDTTTARTHWGRIGWMFRAQDTNTGYLWILSNQPYGKYPARLYKDYVRNGSVAMVNVVGVPTPLSSTSMNLIRTRAIGPKIRTWVNGKVVDTTMQKPWWDRHLWAGYAGVRESNGFSAYFDDFSVSRPPAIGYRMFLGENFNSASLVNFPALNTYRRHGIKISDNSCGGQPADVATLRAPNSVGWEYLFQSDRWDNADPNEAQATQYWEPLSFNADGSIRALTCGAIHKVVLSDATTSSSPVGAPDNGADGTAPGLDGFALAQDITATHPRGQSFAVSATHNLTQVAVTLFQTDDTNENAPNADLLVSLYDVGGPTGTPTYAANTPLATAVVPQSSISWAPRTVNVPLSAALSAGHQYAFVLSTASTTGMYGTARADGTTGDLDPNGSGLVASGDAASPTWTLEPTNDLRYALTLS